MREIEALNLILWEKNNDASIVKKGISETARYSLQKWSNTQEYFSFFEFLFWIPFLLMEFNRKCSENLIFKTEN